MNLAYYIVDDEVLSAKVLRSELDKIVGLTYVGMETDAEKALAALLDGTVIADILFLDINMPNIKGTRFADLVRNIINVIFVTGFDTYALKAFDLGVYGYVMKPVTEEKLKKAINRVREKFEKTVPLANKLVLKDGKVNQIVLNVRDVIFVDSDGNYTTFHLRDNKMHMMYIPLKELAVKAYHQGLVQVHRTFIVNLDQVTFVKRKVLQLASGETLPIGPKHRKQFLQALVDFGKQTVINEED